MTTTRKKNVADADTKGKGYTLAQFVRAAGYRDNPSAYDVQQKRLSDQLDQFARGQRRSRAIVVLEAPPPVLQRLGVKANKRIVLSTSKLNDVLRDHPEVSLTMLKNSLIASLVNPVMVVESASRPKDSLVVFTKIFIGSKPIIIAVYISKNPRTDNAVSSFYAKDAKAVIKWLWDERRLKYANKKESVGFLRKLGVQFSLTAIIQRSRFKVLTEDDFVNSNPSRMAKAAISAFDTDYDLDLDLKDVARLKRGEKKLAKKPAVKRKVAKNPLDPIVALSTGLSGVVSALTIRKMLAEDEKKKVMRRKVTTRRKTNGKTALFGSDDAYTMTVKFANGKVRAVYVIDAKSGKPLANYKTLAGAKRYAAAKGIRLEMNPQSVIRNPKSKAKANPLSLKLPKLSDEGVRKLATAMVRYIKLYGPISAENTSREALAAVRSNKFHITASGDGFVKISLRGRKTNPKTTPKSKAAPAKRNGVVSRFIGRRKAAAEYRKELRLQSAIERSRKRRSKAESKAKGNPTIMYRVWSKYERDGLTATIKYIRTIKGLTVSQRDNLIDSVRMYDADTNRNPKTKMTRIAAKRAARFAGVDFDKNFFELGSYETNTLADLAKAAGYRKPKNAKGSTARYFFAYLQKMKEQAKGNPVRKAERPPVRKRNIPGYVDENGIFRPIRGGDGYSATAAGDRKSAPQKRADAKRNLISAGKDAKDRGQYNRIWNKLVNEHGMSQSAAQRAIGTFKDAELKQRRKAIRKSGLAKANPKTTARRRTYEMFQGRRVTNYKDLEVSRFAPDRMDQLGDLIELKLADGRFIKPNPTRFKLCAAGGKMWIAGGKFARANPKGKANELNPIERIDHVVYRTHKPHHGDKPKTHYIHLLGEETGHMPMLAVDREGFPVIRGGKYKIEARGIVN